MLQLQQPPSHLLRTRLQLCTIKVAGRLVTEAHYSGMDLCGRSARDIGLFGSYLLLPTAETELSMRFTACQVSVARFAGPGSLV